MTATTDFTGVLLRPGDPGYEAARRVESDTVDRRPALIARCATAGEVAAALRLARGAGLPVTVRAGGHGPDGFAVADGALVIDLSPMRGVAVDARRRRARVQGGATWRDLDAATSPHALAVTGARIPSVGVAGFMLGSGSGWLERRHGLAADSLRAATVVTASGELVTASRREHPELFWALRGGGPSFGIVAELELALHPVGPAVLGGLLAWPAARAGDVAEVYTAVMEAAPDDLGGGLTLLAAPAAAYIPPALHGVPLVAVVVLWTGAPAAADALLAPLRDLAPAVDAVRPMPYAAFQGMFEARDHATARVHGEGGFLTALPGAAVTALAELQERKPAALGSLLLQPLGGAFARMPEGATPLTQRDAPWAWQAGAAWFDAAADGAVRAWMRDVRSALAPWTRGEAYPNFIPDADPARLRAAYRPEDWARLRAIRAEWDPDGILAAGHAIPL